MKKVKKEAKTYTVYQDNYTTGYKVYDPAYEFSHKPSDTDIAESFTAEEGMNTIMEFEEALKLAKTESQRVVLGYISRVLERMPEGSKMSGEVFVSDYMGAAVVMVAPAGGCEFYITSTKEGVEVAPVGDERRSVFLDSKRMNSDFAGDFIVDYMNNYKK